MNMKLKASAILLSMATLWSMNVSANSNISVSGTLVPGTCAYTVQLSEGGSVDGQDANLAFGPITASQVTGGNTQARAMVLDFATCDSGTYRFTFDGTASDVNPDAWALTGTAQGLYMQVLNIPNQTFITPNNNVEDNVVSSENTSFGYNIIVKGSDVPDAVRPGEFSGNLALTVVVI